MYCLQVHPLTLQQLPNLQDGTLITCARISISVVYVANLRRVSCNRTGKIMLYATVLTYLDLL